MNEEMTYEKALKVKQEGWGYGSHSYDRSKEEYQKAVDFIDGWESRQEEEAERQVKSSMEIFDKAILALKEAGHGE